MTTPRAKYTYSWVAWVALTSSLEGVALYLSRRHGRKDTLTAHVRFLLGIDPKTKYHWIGRLLFIAACVWAAHHIALEAPREPRRGEIDV